MDNAQVDKRHTWYGLAMGLAIGSFISAGGYSLPDNERGYFFALVYLIITFLVIYRIAKYKQVETSSVDEE